MVMVEQVEREKQPLKYALLSFLLTAKAKRILLFGSLYGTLHRHDDNYIMLKGLADMNERLEIAESVSALMFAARLGITAWKDLDSETLLNETTNYDETVQCIMQRVPPWLYYDDKATIRQEIKKLLVRVCVPTTQRVVQLYGK
ncbi:TPA: hypothetical protein KXY68_004829 [Escherichia coli]|nr:hypothetical protein [Escherichia coli]